MEKNKEKQLKWMFQQTKGTRKFLFLSSIITMIFAASGLAGAYVVVLFMEVVEGTSALNITSVIMLAIIITMTLCTSLFTRGLLDVHIGNIFNEKLREKIIRSIYNRSFLHISKRHTSELMMRLMDDARAIPGFFLRLSSGLLSDAIILIGSIAIMLTLSWQLSLIIFAIVITMTAIMVTVGKLLKKATLNTNKQYDVLRINMQENVMNLLIFKAYAMLERRIKDFSKLYANFAKANMKDSKISYANMVISNAFNGAIMIVTFGLGSIFVMNGTITIAALVGISFLHGNLWQPLWNMSSYIQLFAQSSASAQRIREILDMPQANEEPASNIGRLEGLAIENLSFSYDDKEVLKGVSLQMKPGDIAGIIGESGSGKSTLTKILMGFYKPSAGNITLKGSRGTARDFLNYIAYVPSNDFLFSGSISENICMSADVDKAKMEQAAKAAGIYDFILSLENKFDTFIGEGSNKLSSGQSQRIGIARALYANKPILIFDEPTSNLDSDAIGTLHASIREISRDKICIIVTHDLATRDICSKVYSINDGVITYTQNEGEYPLRKVS